MNEAKHTPGPWYVGSQNDALYIVAGRAPSMNNDYPVHDAKRVAVAKVYPATDADALPVDENANAAILAAAPEMLKELKWVRANYAAGATSEINARIAAVIAKAEGRS